ncbi:MAG: hypothetical protein KME11_04790 [Timaviella obliquedivisa GSE-PSE-MK23-08B]|jgi:hypothetical protein|nr:hypothetical protein [Timaviella obliquedivisa GSE-PSE-MK23-08B]
MAGIYNFLDTVFSGGTPKSDIGMRVNASLPQGTDQELRQLNNMPSSISQEEYWAEEQKTGELSMSALLMKQYVKCRAIQRSSITQIRGAILQDKSGQMRAAMTMGQQDLRHQTTAISHNIMLGGQQRQMTGYAAAASGTRTLI